MNKKKVTTIAALLLNSAVAQSDKCYGLALSSGDESAAYQAGVLKGFVDNLPADQYAYQAVSGVSGGAINSVLFSSFAQADEKAATARMVQFWQDAGKSKLYQDWWGGILEGLFAEGGLYDDTPLKEFLQKQFEGIEIKRPVNVGITNVLDGKFEMFTETNMTSSENLDLAMLASFTTPGFFPPVDAMGSSWFDGSAIWDIDVFSVVNKCKSLGFADKDIVVDVVMTSSASIKDVQAKDYSTISMLFRFLDISTFYGTMDGLLRSKFAWPDVDFRYAVAPSKTLPSSWYPMSLKEDQINDIIAIGEADAKTAIDGKQSLDALLHYHHLKKTGDERTMKMHYGAFVEAKANGEFEDFTHDVMKKNPLYAKYKFLNHQ